MNKRFLPVLLLAVLFSVLFYSCKKETNEFNGNYSSAYFPLQVGRYVVYDVDSTIWDDFLQVKSLHKYQMRYTVADTFTDDLNRMSYRIDVHLRTADSLGWNVHRVIYATPDSSHIEYVEANVRFIKLVLPIANEIEWPGNSMIATDDQDLQYFADWIYKYKDFEQPFNNGKVMFDNTVTVEETDQTLNDPEAMPNAFATRTFSKEVYGYNIGMVYREVTRWTYDPDVVKFRRGYSVVMRAVDHN